jgi:primosomal protein N'
MNSWKEECPGCGSISLLVKQFGIGTMEVAEIVVSK